MTRLDLIVVDSMARPGSLSLRSVDMFGRQYSLQTTLERAGFRAGQRVILVEADEITDAPLDIEITEGVPA